MRILSFDTSSSCLSVAIAENGLILAEANIDGNRDGESRAKADRQESVSLLLPTIDKLTRDLGLKKQDYNAVVIGVGPGGFTGVRVAVVTGRTLAQALNLPLIGINSLETASYLRPSQAGAGVLKWASKTHCFLARYERASVNGIFYDLKATREPGYMSVDDFEAELVMDQNSRWQAEPQLMGRLESYASRIESLAPVNNVAAIQAKIAHLRLSLKADMGEDVLVSFPFRLSAAALFAGGVSDAEKGRCHRKSRNSLKYPHSP